ncbi:MprA protease, GlyGly-CTERM protein-sorting domain-containing form [Streptomyces sp. NPDC006422]|uniref:MprA protease, GlyGly-CTERM protein-sorting domain-containing form n=1 Tax=unclassified Streptomyces TaxID=2593676 RepID=UPI0033B0951B
MSSFRSSSSCDVPPLTESVVALASAGLPLLSGALYQRRRNHSSSISSSVAGSRGTIGSVVVAASMIAAS